MIRLYIDGSYNSHSKCGGYAVMAMTDKILFTYSNGMYGASPNEMESYALYAALVKTRSNISSRDLCKQDIVIYTDSTYVQKAMEPFKDEQKTNAHVFKAIDRVTKELIEKYSVRSIFVKWIKGHDNRAEHDIVDELANKARLEKEKQKYGEKRQHENKRRN